MSAGAVLSDNPTNNTTISNAGTVTGVNTSVGKLAGDAGAEALSAGVGIFQAVWNCYNVNEAEFPMATYMAVYLRADQKIDGKVDSNDINSLFGEPEPAM